MLLKKRSIWSKFFQTKLLFAKSFSFFVSNEAPISCFSTLHFNIFFWKSILHLAESFCNKDYQQNEEYFFAVRRKGRLFLQQKFKKKIDKVFHKTARLLYCHHCKIFFESAATVSTKACKTNFAFAYNFFWDFKQLMN